MPKKSNKKTIKINQIDKIEGHAGFISYIVNGNVEKARFEVIMGIRLFERIMVGRKFEEAANISARICGVCPVVHYLTALKAIESALDVKVSEDTTMMRKILMLGQFIQSHTLHVYFLSLSDFFDISDAGSLVKKFPKYTKLALSIREYGNELIHIFGGRSVHPVSCKIGGFRVVPKMREVEKLLEQNDEILKQAIKLGEFFADLNYPGFSRETEYVALKDNKEYSIYNGNITSTKGLDIAPEEFERNIEEIQLPYEAVKRVKKNDKEVMVGALARLNINHDKLNPEAKKILKKSGIMLPSFNSFFNIMAQMIEIIDCIEESGKLLKKVLKLDLKNIAVDYKVKEGYGVGAIEAPRGTLYHAYSINNKGRIEKLNIITPTAQLISNMEKDLEEYLPNIINLSEKEKIRKIKMMIRAYDPCITCSVH